MSRYDNCSREELLRRIEELEAQLDTPKGSGSRFRERYACKILDSIPDMLTVLDRDGTLVELVSADETNHVGVPGGELAGQNIRTMLSPAACRNVKNNLDNVFATGCGSSSHHDITLDGRTRNYENRIFPLDGEHALCICRDITEAEAAKHELEIPCVLYGGEEVVHFTVTNEGLRNLVYTPHIYVVDLVIDGKKVNAILKDIQFHPVKDTILHVDFYQIDEAKPIVMEVPVQLEGLAEGVKAGGKLALQMRKLKVKALYNIIPEKLTINVSHLGLGKTVKVGELSYEGLELLNAKEAVVCAVKLTRAARGAAAAAGK